MRKEPVTIVALALLCLMMMAYCLFANTLLSTTPVPVVVAAQQALQQLRGDGEQSEYSIEMQFDWLNKRLVGPPISAIDYGVNDVDYPAWYTVQDIQKSVDFMEEHQDVLVPYVTRLQQTRAREAKMQCDNILVPADGLKRGGWCLDMGNKRTDYLFNTSHAIPKHHVEAAERVNIELSDLITRENIKSINDFGAGVGQYKAEMLKRHPGITYEAYDGAGNGVEYTKGFLKFFDLTYPLALPKAEWVFSLEVGEHIPSQYEGMLIRNLHQHNTKGIIMSWAVLGQGGTSHVNCHSNEYVIRLMESLGYTADLELADKFRQKDKNHNWFPASIMVFRRNQTDDSA